MRNVLKYVIRIDNYILLCMKNEVIKFVFIMFDLKFILQSQINRIVFKKLESNISFIIW